MFIQSDIISLVLKEILGIYLQLWSSLVGSEKIRSPVV